MSRDNHAMSASENVEERLVNQFLDQVSRQETAQPAPAVEQWLTIQWRLERDRRRRVLKPLRWTRTVALFSTVGVAVAMAGRWSGWTRISSILSSPATTWTSPFEFLLSAQVFLVVGLVVMATLFYLEGENWIES